MKRLFVPIILCVLTLAGCGIVDGAVYSSYPEERAAEYDAARLFVKENVTPTATEYLIYYRNSDGSEREIASMGFTDNPFYIIGDRIYYTRFDSLRSVDFTGMDTIYFYEYGIYINSIDKVDGDWLECTGRQQVEIYGDPVALDGIHHPITQFKVKVDFSEFHVIETD